MVVRRFDLRTLAFALLAVALLEVLDYLELIHFPWPDLLEYNRYPLIDPVSKFLGVVPFVLLADALVAQGTRPVPTYVTCVAIGATIASAIQAGVRIATDTPLIPYLKNPPLVMAMQPVYIASLVTIHAGAATLIYTYLRSAYIANAERRRVELARLNARRATVELRLQSMQARVDPSFLFTTLAQVGPIHKDDPARADRLLDNLIAYLRAALPRPHDAPSTFTNELHLLRSYFHVMSARCGRTITVSIDVDDATNGAHLPPMLLLPLVTHLHEGIVANGAVQIVGRAADGRLELVVGADGATPAAAFPEPLRDRLIQLFDDDFALDARLRPDGSMAQVHLEIPLDVADRRRR